MTVLLLAGAGSGNATSGNMVVWHMDQAGNRTSGLFTTPSAPAPNPTDWTLAGPR